VIRVGTRASALAQAQAHLVAEGLRSAGATVELVPMRTEGDRLGAARLGDLGGKGLFVREIEEALMAGAVDVAVHSLKDLPAELPAALELAAFPEREDPRDVLVTRTGGELRDLPPRAVVGTGSLRRRAFVLALRRDLVVEAIRGNVDTRLRRLAEGVWDAIILAAAGLKRLGLGPAHALPLPADVFVPAVGQGILGIEVRRDDRATRRLVQALDHADTRACALAERAYLMRLGASCATPLAGHARVDRSGGGARLSMTAVVASEDGARLLRAEAAGAPEDAQTLGRGLAESLLQRGAEAVAQLNPGRWAS
jgi:hydroxymethylbilane synthase